MAIFTLFYTLCLKVSYTNLKKKVLEKYSNFWILAALLTSLG